MAFSDPDLLLERPDVLDERPAFALGQLSPGRHRAAAGRDLPEELAVRLVLNPLRGPVGGLGVEGHGRSAIALSALSVARDAVDLGDLLSLLGHLGAGRD